jgi:hypothetical protein
MKNSSTSLSTKEMQIKTPLKFHFPSDRMARITEANKTNAGKDVGGKEP